jgi:N-methylhydantoinase A/oxoprolinase/acetone carboxylase beta subunit
MAFRISVDTGGTFTDVVIADARGIRTIGKALTTPDRIFDGMRAAIEVAAQEIGLSREALLGQSDMLIYGTTRATNAVVTQSTAKTAFLTTRGFRDVLVLKEGGKYDPHDYSYDYPPLTSRGATLSRSMSGSTPRATSSTRLTKIKRATSCALSPSASSRRSRFACCGRSPTAATRRKSDD